MTINEGEEGGLKVFGGAYRLVVLFGLPFPGRYSNKLVVINPYFHDFGSSTLYVMRRIE